MKNFLSFGNDKLSKQVGIFNMGSSLNCPTKKLVLCPVINKGLKCYGCKIETFRPNTFLHHEKQGEYWDKSDVKDIAKNIRQKIERRNKRTRYIRFNAFGDFKSQEDVEKLKELRSYFSTGIDPIFYGYTSRLDLNLKQIKFILKGSGKKGPYGRTEVIQKGEKVPKGYHLCPKKGCGETCFACMRQGNIALPYH